MADENMIIDVIAFTDAQFASLTDEQLLEVQAAQQRKNRLKRQLDENLRTEKNRLVKNGLFHSEIYDLIEEKLCGEYETEISLIKEGLLFYLRYAMRPGTGITPDTAAPYLVDYSLSYEERAVIVKEYYDTAFNSYVEAYEAFLKDEVAPQYMGEYYGSLDAYLYAGAFYPRN